MRFTVQIHGEPKGQPRPRAFARKVGDKVVVRCYDAGTAEGWKARIAAAIQPHLPAEPVRGPVAMKMVFKMPRPKSHYRRQGLKPSAPNEHTVKPDGDNLEKAVCDALTGLIYHDDSQVFHVERTKQYAFHGEPEGLTLTVICGDGERVGGAA